MLMLPSVPKALAVAVTAVATFGVMDANPSLWLFDILCATNHRLEREFGGKRIWITGASSGIGAELAQQLAACNATVILSGRNEERLQNVAKKCGKDAASVVVMKNIDCSDQEMTQVLNKVGPVDYVILNAGIGQQLPSFKTSREETEELFRVNALAPIHWAQAMLKQDKPPSHLAVTSSVAAKFAVPLSASYAASKHAVNGYFHTLACEHPTLTISLPCPGPVSTPLFGTESSSKERKMQSSRCARLIISTMVMGGGETWIAQQPTLLFCYITQLFPGFANSLLRRFLGPTRLAMWDAGLNIYDPASLTKLRKLQKEDKDSS